MGRSFLPTTDDGLLSFALNFSTLLTANFAAYGVTTQVASTYSSKYNTYKTALQAAQQPSTRGNASVLAKDLAKKDLTGYTRSVARAINNDLTVTDPQRQALGLTIRKTHPTPVPPPSVRPACALVSAVMRTVTVRIYDSASATKRGKPANIIGAKVYTFLGAEYPSDPALWTYNGDATKDKYEITFATSVPAGAQVWVCTAWFNRRGETGPVSVPISTNIQGGGAMQEQQGLKIAA